MTEQKNSTPVDWAKRRANICKMYNDGLLYREIAEKIGGVTTTRVTQIIRAEKAKGNLTDRVSPAKVSKPAKVTTTNIKTASAVVKPVRTRRTSAKTKVGSSVGEAKQEPE